MKSEPRSDSVAKSLNTALLGLAALFCLVGLFMNHVTLVDRRPADDGLAVAVLVMGFVFAVLTTWRLRGHSLMIAPALLAVIAGREFLMMVL